MLYLYWFKDKPNVGDAASNLVISAICRERPFYKSPATNVYIVLKRYLKTFSFNENFFKEIIFCKQQCLMAIGSILDSANSKCLIWGSGFREYESKYNGGQIFAVRGYLSRSKLPPIYEKVPVGDPAMLLPLIIRRQKSTNVQPRVCIIPHYYDYTDLYDKFHNKYDILDVRTENVEDFISKLLTYDYILSSSLHGLIIAHAYGLPAIWIYKNYINSGSFKFHDYFSSVDIPFYEGFTNIDNILKDDQSWNMFFRKHKNISLPKKDISAIQKQLLSVFPYELEKWCSDFIKDK